MTGEVWSVSVTGEVWSVNDWCGVSVTGEVWSESVTGAFLHM